MPVAVGLSRMKWQIHAGIIPGLTKSSSSSNITADSTVLRILVVNLHNRELDLCTTVVNLRNNGLDRASLFFRVSIACDTQLEKIPAYFTLPSSRCFVVIIEILTLVAWTVDPLRFPGDERRAKYATMQERARKDIERTFGVLKKRWRILDSLKSRTKLRVSRYTSPVVIRILPYERHYMIAMFIITFRVTGFVEPPLRIRRAKQLQTVGPSRVALKVSKTTKE
ncbi:hypothetical protein LXL04_029550 [Taraxacum kok-saghyz]